MAAAEDYLRSSGLSRTGENTGVGLNLMSAILSRNGGLDEYEKGAFHNTMVLFDFRSHLYAPLVCLKKSSFKLQVSPVSLNEDEKKFVDLLKKYADNHVAELADKSLYLLRNKSKVGMGFFEAGNFYPDYILWIDTGETQYISFIDPKGLMRVKQDDPKIMFYKTIKNLETRLAPTAKDKRIILNSFILSGTTVSELQMSWYGTEEFKITKVGLAERNIYTLDDPDCVEEMVEKNNSCVINNVLATC